MILDQAPPQHLLRKTTGLRALRSCKRLIERFAAVYPDISYQIFWPSDLCNGQATMLQGRRCVRLYGGLVRHKQIGLAGLAFTLAHETGHHMGGPPTLKYYPWLSSEDRADQWAIETGLAEVFGLRKARLYIDNGQKQLAKVYASLLL